VFSSKLGELFVELSARGLENVQSALDKTAAGLKKGSVTTKASTKDTEAQIDSLAKAIGSLNAKNEKMKLVDEFLRAQSAVGQLGLKVDGLKDKFAALGSFLPLTFGAATASITGMVSAASPEAFLTFTNSIRYLSATIGMQFIPYVAQASQWLQDTARWVAGLDQGTKDSIVSWTMYGVAALGVAMILPRVISLLGVLRSALAVADTAAVLAGSALKSLFASGLSLSGMFGTLAGGVRSAATAMMAFTMSNPVTMIVGLIAVVGGLAYAFGRAGESVHQLEARMQRASDLQERLRRGQAPTRQELQEIVGRDYLRSVEGRAPEVQQQMIRQRIQALQQQRDATDWTAESISTSDRAAQIFRQLNEASRSSNGGVLTAEQRQINEDRSREQAELDGPSGLLRTEISMLTAVLRNGIPGSIGGPGGPGGLLTSSNFQSQMISLDQQWTRLQQAAASGGTLDQQLLNLQMQGNASLQQIASNTSPTNQPVPAPGVV